MSASGGAALYVFNAQADLTFQLDRCQWRRQRHRLRRHRGLRGSGHRQTGRDPAAKGSGGTIANMTGANLGLAACAVPGGIPAGVGVYLKNANGVSLRGVRLHDFANYAMLGYEVTNFSLTDSTVDAGERRFRG